MAEPEGPPRTSKNVNDFVGMNSQDGRWGNEDAEFFWLENVMRVGPGKLKSVPGPSGIVASYPQDIGDGFLLLEDLAFILLEHGGKIVLE